MRLCAVPVIAVAAAVAAAPMMMPSALLLLLLPAVVAAVVASVAVVVAAVEADVGVAVVAPAVLVPYSRNPRNPCFATLATCATHARHINAVREADHADAAAPLKGDTDHAEIQVVNAGECAVGRHAPSVAHLAAEQLAKLVCRCVLGEVRANDACVAEQRHQRLQRPQIKILRA
eukprot:12119712-Alexandrium_andersonii.AAC.1